MAHGLTVAFLVAFATACGIAAWRLTVHFFKWLGRRISNWMRELIRQAVREDPPDAEP